MPYSASVPSDQLRTGTKKMVKGIRSLGADNTGEPGRSAPHFEPGLGGAQNITCGCQEHPAPSPRYPCFDSMKHIAPASGAVICFAAIAALVRSTISALDTPDSTH